MTLKFNAINQMFDIGDSSRNSKAPSQHISEHSPKSVLVPDRPMDNTCHIIKYCISCYIYKPVIGPQFVT